MNSKLMQSKDVVWEELDDHALLVNSQTGARWTLNAAALALWKLCDGTRTAESLAQTLASTMRGSLSECLVEMESFARSLNETGLLHGVGAEVKTRAAQPAQYMIASATLRANCLGSLGSPRRRPSPRGNSGPG